MNSDKTDELLDGIDELIDESLAQGEAKPRRIDKCPHCDRAWHGLRITQRIGAMYSVRLYDPSYSYKDDTSPVICEGSDFIGPMQAPPISTTIDWSSIYSGLMSMYGG